MRLQKAKKKKPKWEMILFIQRFTSNVFLIEMQKKKIPKKLSCCLNKWKLDLPKISWLLLSNFKLINIEWIMYCFVGDITLLTGILYFVCWWNSVFTYRHLITEKNYTHKLHHYVDEKKALNFFMINFVLAICYLFVPK